MQYTFDDILKIIDDEIKKISYVDNTPQSLFEPIIYTLALGGKRVRPSLALMSYNLYDANVEKAMPIALGIEIFHNFTLLHDDLMDRASMRRGKPTVHVKWNDNTAVLSGDAMLIEAYREICKLQSVHLLPEVLELFSQTATQICCGQQLDMEFEHRMDVTVDEYLEMIRLKTAVLLGCALKEGAIVAEADSHDADLLYKFGISLGMAFQLCDDLLDVYGNPLTFGKKIGGDILCNKKTFLLITALADKEANSDLMKWIEKTDFDETEKIEAVTSIYDKLGLKARSEELIISYYKQSIDYLKQVNLPEERKTILYRLAEDLMIRKS